MSMFPEIKSNDYRGTVNHIVVSYKYFVNELDQWWYCFDDIMEFIRMNKHYANDLYWKIDDPNKMMVEDWNNDLRDKQSVPRRFVTSEVVRQFIQRNNERNNTLIKSMNILEFREDSHVKYFEDEEIVDSINKLYKSIECKDYEEMSDHILYLYHTDSIRDILDKHRDDFDKDIEKAVDTIRDYMYKDEIDCIICECNNEERIKLSKEEDVWNVWFPGK